MTRSHFVEDLIPLILDSGDHWWDRDLTRLALVSPAWLYHVQKRLYAFPSLSTYSACSSLVRTLEACPYLASSIQQLALRPTYDTASRDFSSIDPMAVRTLLGLEGLRGLVLGGDLAVQSERFLGFVSASETLTQLYIDGTLLRESLVSPASLEWTEDLIFRFPNLKKLKLVDLELDINPVFTSFPFQIREVVLEGVTIINGLLSHLIPKGSVLNQLCVRASSACEYDEHIRSLLFSSEIHNLEYEVQRPGASDGSFLEPEGIPDPHALCLRRLELHGLQVDNRTLALIGQWCPEVEEVVISGRAVSVTPEDWKVYLASGALSSLQRLTLSWGTNYPPYRAWCSSTIKAISEGAALRSVKLLPYSY